MSVVNGFDAQYYLAHNPDVAAAGVNPLQHYEQFGWHEGRNPNADFDTNYYLAHNPDVAAAGVNPLQHYEQFGWLEGRNPSAAFNTDAYLAANPDVAAAHVNPLDHYLNFGINEGRLLAPTPTSDVASSGSLTITMMSGSGSLTMSADTVAYFSSSGADFYFSSSGADTLGVVNLSPVDITGQPVSSSVIETSTDTTTPIGSVGSVYDYLLHA